MTLRRSVDALIGVAVLFLVGAVPLVGAIQSGASDSPKPPQVQQESAESPEASQPDLASAPTRVIRLQLDEYGNPIALQTATKKFVLKNDKGEVDLEVFLESVIHIADSSYYRGFQQRFERYDSVLYELVAEQPERRPSDDDLPSGFDLFRQISIGTLGLAHQLESIDYSPPNMVHADLSPSEMADRMKDRGETKTTLLVDMMAHIIKTAGAKPHGDGPAAEEEGAPDGADQDDGDSKPDKPFGLSLLTDPDGIMKIRRLMASALVDSQLLDSVFPPSIHRLLISDRNDRVMSVLNSERKNGKHRIAIFYGAGHMADFERRLVNEYGMELAEENWRSAWDLRDGAIAGGPLEGLIESTFRDSIKEKLSKFAKGRQRESEPQGSGEALDSDKDAKIKAMENTLKELEAKLKKLEDEAQQRGERPPEKSKDPSDSDGV